MPISNNKKPSALNIEKNPFYILNVSCVDNRRKIISAAEEMSFLSDADICTEAQNILLTPSKRLSAELDWFIETDISLVDEIKICLKSNKPITIENLNALSKLNAILYNFCISKETDSFSLGFEILEIDKQFGKLNSSFLTEIINTCRRTAEIAEATQSDISVELNKKRERIRTAVSEKMQLLQKTDYIKLITLFAEKYIANEKYNDSGIISDIIDQYEIWAKSPMDNAEKKIRDSIEKINNPDNVLNIQALVAELIDLLKRWSIYARPIMLSAVSQGIENNDIKRLALDIRNCAIDLHNIKKQTSSSLKIINVIKDCFSSIHEIYEYSLEDIETLQDLLKAEENAVRYNTDFYKKASANINNRNTSNPRQQTTTGLDKLKYALKYLVYVALAFAVLYGISTLDTSQNSSDNYIPSSYENTITEPIIPEMPDMPTADIDVDAFKDMLENGEKEFSQNINPGTYVYAYIGSIKPSMGVRYNEDTFNSDVVCECETSDQYKIWIYMSVNDYTHYIDSDASILNSDFASFDTVTFSPSKKVRGIAREADYMVDGLSHETGNIVLEFKSIE